MFMCVEYLRDFPAMFFGRCQTLLKVERINRERIPGFGAGNQVVKIAIRIASPDLLDDHCNSSAANTFLPAIQVSSTWMSSISEAGTSK